jgi:hypothetical protein
MFHVKHRPSDPARHQVFAPARFRLEQYAALLASEGVLRG